MSSLPYPWIVAAVAVLIAAGAGFAMLNQPAAVPAGESALDAAAVLLRLQSGIAAALETLDGRLSHAASDLGGTGLNDAAARGVLLNLSVTDPAIVDCTVSDAGGTLIAAEPAAYHGVEGADLRDQPNVRHILASKRPIMSEVITVAEGFPAAVISTPVFTNESRFAGFASVVFRPEVLIAGVAGPAINGTPFQVMVVQTDGRVLYDTDPAQVGRMTFEDPLYADYPDLLDAARRVAAGRYGTATYGFAVDGETVEKEIAWTTAGLHGAEWRVAVIREVG
ncbi:cache domain-containing protein [Methanoculleus sp.]|uniref:cache domain-containing protein n=1 Tax=Methanoculleus sp. TaxID=90427 RepID=UPI00320D406D